MTKIGKNFSMGPAALDYAGLFKEVSACLEQARQINVRAVNAVMTATYWLMGQRLVEFEQKGRHRAAYGDALLDRLAEDLNRKFGRGFSRRNLQQMRLFYQAWPIRQTLSAELGVSDKRQTVSAVSALEAPDFPLPWSHYVRLLSVKNMLARSFYETEALRGGWSVRQLDRQINSQFYERTALSRNKEAMLLKGGKAQAGDVVTAEEAIKDPLPMRARCICT
jgi:hypothetical protein